MFLDIGSLFNRNLRSLLIVYILLITIIFTSCNDKEGSSLEEYETTGRIIDVESYSLTVASKITLQSKNNLIIDYFIQTSLGEFTPGHLRYHMVTGDIVRIFYTVSGNQNVIINIEDYDKVKD